MTPAIGAYKASRAWRAWTIAICLSGELAMIQSALPPILRELSDLSLSDRPSFVYDSNRGLVV